MKITSYYNIYNPNFGYDKKLNRELKDALASCEDRSWAQTLSSMNNYCNKLESNVRENAKKNNPNDSKYNDYLDIFLSVKQILASFVSITFEHLNYADREFTHYYDEYISSGAIDSDWRKEACEALKDWVSPELSDKLKGKTQKAKQSSSDNVEKSCSSDKPEALPAAEKPAQQSHSASGADTAGSLKLPSKSFLEKYTPTSQSPTGFESVAGMSSLKQNLSDTIIEFINNPEQARLDFEEYGKTIPKSILLYGPPGCGKTYITQALAAEAQVPLYLLNISSAGSHYINMTSKNIKAAFDEAVEISKKSDKPCLLFMDEIDSIAFDRNSRMEPDDIKQIATVLQSMDVARTHNVIIIGATNKYNLLDPAIRRRFDSKVFVNIPDVDSIKSLIVKILTPMKKAYKLLSSEEDIETVAKMLKGYSNASISIITKEAALNALHRGRADISVEDYQKAIESTGEEKPDVKEYLSDSKKKSPRIGF